MKAWQEEQLQTLQSIQDDKQLFQTILSLAKALEFEHCAYGLRMPLPLSNPKTLMVNNYPDDWRNQYQAKNYLAVDPTVNLAMRSLAPIIWTDNLFAQARELWEEAHSFGLRFGWAQSIHDFNGAVGMLSLSRGDNPITEEELMEKRFRIAWLTQVGHLRMAEYLTPKLMPEVNVQLSNREIEVLRWTADGKTSCEISVILKISERTVNFHITNITGKLNASNKISAAIKAAMMGLL
ncbi:MAG: autoinducer binding domain-containing protein [Methylococcales bacterium]|nr:autoinducer binding domain-containing protein [Methylococcales bacterium]